MISGEVMQIRSVRRRRIAALTSVWALAMGGAIVMASPAAAAVPPIVQRATNGVTADALPTAQIDGVVWSQAIVGSTVYVGGSFANARPAGAAPGTNQTPRGNLLAYNLTTGSLITGFAPNLNAQVKSVVASPDGSRIYVGGSFTTADGQNRYRLAAYSTSTGKLISSFQPVLNATVNSITVTATTVYAGGIFGIANGVNRHYLAAFNAADGSLTGWAPVVDNLVNAVQLTPNNTMVVVGGAFQTLNGATALGLGALNATTGATQSFAVNQVVKDYGSTGAILSLSTDGRSIFGTGYVYGGASNFEGAFSADPSTGAVNWLEDCHGDSYGAFGGGSQVYVVGHAHYCGNVGAFPDTRASNPGWYRSTAFTTAATGTVSTNAPAGYANFAGQPAPSMVNWYPTIDTGTYTGDSQGAWTVTGNSQYVIEGGEFMHVNGTPQQGLVRFAVPSIAPKKQGPIDSSTAINPTVTVTSNSAATVSWLTNADDDDQVLTYKVWRDDNLSAPQYTTTATSQFWNRPTLTFRDSGLTPGKTYIYWIAISDPNGNGTRSANVTVTMPNNGPTAKFTSTCTNLTCSFDGSSSTDVGSTISSWSWTFGDNTTGSGSTVSHTYAAGSYTVILTVTDGAGLTSTTTKTVTVSAPPPVGTFAQDAFGRTVASGWGTADVGGNWVTSDDSQFSVGNGVGTMKLAGPWAAPLAALPSVSATSVNEKVDVTSNSVATGGGWYLIFHSRANNGSYYSLKLGLLPDNSVRLSLSSVVSGTETNFGTVNVPGLNFTPGTNLTVLFGTKTSGTSTVLTGEVWRAGTTQPTTPQVSQTDGTASLQGSGSAEMQGLLSGSATAPVNLSIDNYSVMAA